MQNPYDQRPQPAKGNLPDEIHLAVGRALTQWERLEFRLSEIYVALLGAMPVVSPAARAFGVVSSSAARIDMLKQAADVFTYPPESQDLKNRLRKFLVLAGRFGSRRNEIAHGQVVTIGGDQSNTMLLPAFYNTRKYDSEDTYRPTYKYGANDVVYYQEWFAKLVTEAEGLRDALGGFPSQSGVFFRAPNA